MRTSRFDVPGFTMIEMLISMATFLLVMGLAFQTLSAANSIRQAAAARVDIFQNGRTTLDILTRELRTATLRKNDVRFLPSEFSSRNLTNFSNNRGRFILNDWPPYLSDDGGKDLRVYRGNGFDDDQDGRTDEEAFDGLDNDGDGEADSPVEPISGRAIADGLDNDGNGLVDEGIDEDFYYPRDMLNFLSLVDTGSGSDLVEIGYAIDTRTSRDLLRRSAFNDPNQMVRRNVPTQVDGLYPVAILYEQGETPSDPVTGVIAPWFNAEDPTMGLEAEDSRIGLSVDGFVPEQRGSILQVVEPVALNILGFDCRAYYHDWVIAEEVRNPGVSMPAVLDNLDGFNPYSFPRLTWDSSVENNRTIPYGLVPNPDGFLAFPNGRDDLAIVEGSSRFNDFRTAPEERARVATANTDGLPRILEVNLFVQDENEFKDEPVLISTRVFLSFETGDE